MPNRWSQGPPPPGSLPGWLQHRFPPCFPWAACACCQPWLPLRLQDKIHRGRACLLLVFKVAGESCSKLQVTAFWDKWTKRGPAGGTRRLDPKERSQLRENVPPQLCTPETVTVASHWSQEPRCPGQGGGQNQSRLGSPPFLGPWVSVPHLQNGTVNASLLGGEKMKWGSQLGTHPVPTVEGASSWVGWSLNLLFHPMRQVWALWAISLNTAHTHTHTHMHAPLLSHPGVPGHNPSGACWGTRGAGAASPMALAPGLPTPLAPGCHAGSQDTYTSLMRHLHYPTSP